MQFLSGETPSIQKRLAREMEEAAERLAARTHGLSPGGPARIKWQRTYGAGDGDSATEFASNNEERQRRFEDRLRHTVEQLLERTLGAGKVRAEVSAEMDFDRINTSEELFDPFAASRLGRDMKRLREWSSDTETGDRDELLPGGALISSVSPPDACGAYGSYVDYIGVHRRARGRGVAKALLHTVIADAARRDRNRVGLEVDADSSTGADGLYLSMGWRTDHRTESWHRYVDADPEA